MRYLQFKIKAGPKKIQVDSKVKVKSLSHVGLFVTLWNAARQAPPSMGFSRQEYWNKLPFPSPQMAGKPMKNCSTSLASKEMQIIIIMRCYFIHNRMSVCKKIYIYFFFYV